MKNDNIFCIDSIKLVPMAISTSVFFLWGFWQILCSRGCFTNTFVSHSVTNSSFSTNLLSLRFDHMFSFLIDISIWYNSNRRYFRNYWWVLESVTVKDWNGFFEQMEEIKPMLFFITVPTLFLVSTLSEY